MKTAYSTMLVVVMCAVMLCWGGVPTAQARETGPWSRAHTAFYAPEAPPLLRAHVHRTRSLLNFWYQWSNPVFQYQLPGQQQDNQQPLPSTQSFASASSSVTASSDSTPAADNSAGQSNPAADNSWQGNPEPSSVDNNLQASPASSYPDSTWQSSPDASPDNSPAASPSPDNSPAASPSPDNTWQNSPQSTPAASSDGWSCSKSNRSADAVYSCVNAVRTNPRGFTGDYPCDWGRWIDSITNQARPAFKRSSQLDSSAYRHSKDMADHLQMTHDGTDGVPFDQRIQDAGFTGLPQSENIAAGQGSAHEVVMDWMCSESGHREAVMDCEEDTIGLATVFGSDNRPYYTMDMGCAENYECTC